MSLSVIIPVYNEAKTVEGMIALVTDLTIVEQVIVVDDGSTDGTQSVLRDIESRYGIKLLYHDTNRGKGAAIRTALEHVSAAFTIIQDADMEYDPGDYVNLLLPFLIGNADVVYGSRYLNKMGDFSGRRRLDWGVKLLNIAVRLICGVKITDEATCYKAFPTSLLRAMDLRCERFDFCPEVTVKTCRLGLTIQEVPISYSPRSIKEGKKIRLRDGVRALWTLWKYRKWQGQWKRDVNEQPSTHCGAATCECRSDDISEKTDDS